MACGRLGYWWARVICVVVGWARPLNLDDGQAGGGVNDIDGSNIGSMVEQQAGVVLGGHRVCGVEEGWP